MKNSYPFFTESLNKNKTEARDAGFRFSIEKFPGIFLALRNVSSRNSLVGSETESDDRNAGLRAENPPRTVAIDRQIVLAVAVVVPRPGHVARRSPTRGDGRAAAARQIQPLTGRGTEDRQIVL